MGVIPFRMLLISTRVRVTPQRTRYADVLSHQPDPRQAVTIGPLRTFPTRPRPDFNIHRDIPSALMGRCNTRVAAMLPRCSDDAKPMQHRCAWLGFMNLDEYRKKKSRRAAALH